jgi:hypothetical protein
MGIEESERKLAELILYISQKCAHDPDFGATKLNKILYFSDFFAYGQWGQSITGAEYQNLKRGPAPRRLLPVRAALQSDGHLVIQPVQLSNGLIQHRTVNLREPNLSLFSGREIALVDQVIDKLAGINATQASELSHQYVGWKATGEGDTIPYASIFLSDAPPTEVEIRRAREIVQEEELQLA